MAEIKKQMPDWIKNWMVNIGTILFLLGLPFGIGVVCMFFFAIMEGSVILSVIYFTITLLILGAANVLSRHASESLRGEVSPKYKIIPHWHLIGLFGLLLIVGVAVTFHDITYSLFSPFLVITCAVIPPLWAVSWFAQRNAEELTRRRAMVAIYGGATVSVAIALILEILFPSIILSLVLGLADIVLSTGENLLDALAGHNISEAITSRGFIYAFVQLAIIAPLAEELAKPLITLPVIGRISKRGAFLVGAMAGVGFAALENILYASFGFYFWAGILLLRSIGAAIHPLGSGLTAMGWHSILRKEPGAWRNFGLRFLVASGIHALWNGGSLLVITLAGAQFFGELPPEIDLLGLSAAGILLAFLIVLGIFSLWVERWINFGDEAALVDTEVSKDTGIVLSDRTIAIWGLACLVAIVPMGITGLQLLFK